MYKALSLGVLGHSLPFEAKAKIATQHGFAGVDMSMEPIEELGLDGVRRILDENGLVAAVCGMPVQFRKDDETFGKDLEALPAYGKAMADVGCTRCATWFMPVYDTPTYEEAFEQLRVRTAAICDVLGEYGIRYGLEFVGPETMRGDRSQEFIYSINTLLPLIKAVDRPNLGMLLDIYHWYTSDGSADDLSKLDDDLIVLVHLNDGQAGVAREDQIDGIRAMPLETGVVDSATFMRALDSLAYSGPLIVEPFSQRIRETPVEDAVAETSTSIDRMLALI